MSLLSRLINLKHFWWTKAWNKSYWPKLLNGSMCSYNINILISWLGCLSLCMPARSKTRLAQFTWKSKVNKAQKKNNAKKSSKQYLCTFFTELNIFWPKLWSWQLEWQVTDECNNFAFQQAQQILPDIQYLTVHSSHFCKYVFIYFHVTTLKKGHLAVM